MKVVLHLASARSQFQEKIENGDARPVRKRVLEADFAFK